MNSFNVASCTVTLEGYSEIGGTAKRMRFLSEAAYELSKMKIDLFVLPGGYLYSSSTGLKPLQLEVSKIAIDTGVDLLVGIDIKPKNNNPESEIIRRSQLSSFSIFASHNNSRIWRQRTTNRTNQYIVSDEVCAQNRTIRYKPHVESLICGEIFNERIRDNLIARKIALAIDQGHTAAGFRVFAAMKVLAQNGISSLCSVHANKKNAVKPCYISKGRGYVRRSSSDFDLLIGDNPRLEIKIWKFDSTGDLVRGL